MQCADAAQARVGGVSVVDEYANSARRFCLLTDINVIVVTAALMVKESVASASFEFKTFKS